MLDDSPVVLGEPLPSCSLGWKDVQTSPTTTSDCPPEVRVERHDNEVVDQGVIDDDRVVLAREPGVTSTSHDMAAADEQ